MGAAGRRRRTPDLIGLYVAATVLFLPGSVLTLVGGALFGPVRGTLYSLSGATLDAALAFLIARYLARDWVQARATGLLARLVQGVEAEGWPVEDAHPEPETGVTQ